MADQLSPQEADRALREMSQRRHQVAAVAAPWPMIAISCLLLVAFGFTLDQFPQTSAWLGNVLIAVCFVLMYLARTRQVGARLGHRVAPARVKGAWGVKALHLMLLLGAAALMLLTRHQLIEHDVAWPNLITYGLLGSVLALLIVGLLNRMMRSPQPGADHRGR